jgi:1,2-diacylglycerol 3-alpha-glucosyltransferase
MTEDHLTQPWPMRPFKGLIRHGIGYCCKRVDHIISVSQNLAQQIAARNYGTPVSYISNPVNFSNDAATTALHTGSAFTVLFAGRLNPEKNIPLLLRGFSLVLAQKPDARLFIAGEGSQRGALLRIAADLNIESSTSFLGFLPASELAVRYRSCDVFVLPSWVETQGLVAMEAMHFAKPVLVARSVVSADELVDEGINGYLIDPSAEADLAQRLLELADDPALRERMGQAGRRMAERFRPELVAEQLEALYRATLAGSEPRSARVDCCAEPPKKKARNRSGLL